MGSHFYNPYENKVSVAHHAELFENSLKCTRSEWESHSSKSEWEYHFQQNTGEIHWTAVKTILKYLRNTKDMVLVYGEKHEAEMKVSSVDWKSAKQSTTAMSSTKAEYIAAAEASMEVVWMRKFIDGLGDVVPSNKRPMEMLCDNEHAIAIAADPEILKGARHYQRTYHYIREMENLNEVRVKELRSDNRTEFRNHKLEEFCDEKGISHNFSSPCTPEQNGVAERRNRTLIEAARTMSPDISYFYVFGCPVHIHNHMDHLGKFDEKADNGLFLDSVSPEEPSEFTYADDYPALNDVDQPELADNLEPVEIQDNVINEPISDVQPSPIISPSVKGILQHPIPQDRWSREKHIELVNIIGKPLAGIATRSKVRDSEDASTHECLYVNFLSKMEPKKLFEAMEEEG
ncbi:retrovirus-related pol polyprotein from transposon TNT 1-94 [Tanacetum coccineum]